MTLAPRLDREIYYIHTRSLIIVNRIFSGSRNNLMTVILNFDETIGEELPGIDL